MYTVMTFLVTCLFSGEISKLLEEPWLTLRRLRISGCHLLDRVWTSLLDRMCTSLLDRKSTSFLFTKKTHVLLSPLTTVNVPCRERDQPCARTYVRTYVRTGHVRTVLLATYSVSTVTVYYLSDTLFWRVPYVEGSD